MKLTLRSCSYGFRLNRSAHQALGGNLRPHLKAGFQAVYDADLKGYFDSIPQDKLMGIMPPDASGGPERAETDPDVAGNPSRRAGRRWWRAGQVEPPRNGERRRAGVISPLLANLYLHWFDKLFHRGRWTGRVGKCANWYAMPTTLPCWRAIKVHGRLQGWIEAKIEKWLRLESQPGQDARGGSAGRES